MWPGKKSRRQRFFFNCFDISGLYVTSPIRFTNTAPDYSPGNDENVPVLYFHSFGNTLCHNALRQRGGQENRCRKTIGSNVGGRSTENRYFLIAPHGGVTGKQPGFRSVPARRRSSSVRCESGH
jgi:hypothetical protein